MKKKVIIIAIIVVVVALLVLALLPQQMTGTIAVSSGTGETAQVSFDLLVYSNILLPSYVKGTLVVDGVAYTDQYTMLQKFPSVSDNRLFPSDWWNAKSSVPYNMTFVRSDCTDAISAQQNRITVLDIVFNKGISQIHYMYTDESNQVDTSIEGISFWGPAQNAEDAKRIAEFFGYTQP